MTGSQSVLLSLVAKALFGRTESIEAIINKCAEGSAANINGESVETIDWSSVLKEAELQGVVQLVFSAIDSEKNTLGGKQAEWQDSTAADMINSIVVIHTHRQLHQWMTDAGIPYVILKGCASAAYYPKPEIRSMGDVDFLVPDEFLDKADKLLMDYGLESSYRDHVTHIVYRRNEKNLEMHFDLPGMPKGEIGEVTREYMADIFDASVVRDTGSGDMVLPSSFHHGVILLLHTCHHLTGEGVGLRHLCDWAVFENSFSDAEFRDMFEAKLKRIGLWKFAQILTKTAVNYIGAEPREWANCDEKLAERLIDDILSGGNFGSKDWNRSVQTMLISDRGKSGVGKTSMKKEAISSANEIVCSHWPKARKNKLLLPVGWVYFGGRRFFRELAGKKEKTTVKAVVKGAAERRELYKQFDIFVRESQ